MRSGTVRRAAAVLGATTLAFVALGACGASASPATTTTSAPTSTSSTVVTPNALSPGDHDIGVTVNGMLRTFILHVPPNPAVKDRPLVLVYHGALDTAANTAKETDFEKVANQYGEVVAFLQGYANTWNEGAGHTPAEEAHVNDVAFTAAAIARIEQLVTFDHKRIAATGFSNGALMVEYLGCQLAAKLAVIIPVEGQLPVSVAANCRPARAVSVYEIHGTADASIPYDGGHFSGVGGGTTVLSAPKSVAKWAALDGCGATPTVTYPVASIKLTAYTGCRNKTTVTLRTIEGGTHEWGSEIGLLVDENIPG